MFKRLAVVLSFAALLSAVPLVQPAASAAAVETSGTNGLDPGITVGVFSRLDDLNWNIAGNSAGTSPNIRSELRWENLDSVGVLARAVARFRGPLYFRAGAGGGVIYDGSNQDSDYNGDNRTLEFSRSNNAAGEGSFLDLSAGVGYVVVDTELKVVPVAGLSYNRQNLTITDGYQTVCVPPSCTAGGTGPFSGLDSTYEAWWFGPWAGVDLSYSNNVATIFALIEYHLARFRAEADWNLRTDLEHPKSFTHEADGSGFLIILGLSGRYTERLHLGGELEFRNFMAEDGTHTYKFASAPDSDVKLNEVNWDTISLSFTVRYEF